MIAAALIASTQASVPNLKPLEARLDAISQKFRGRLGYRLNLLDSKAGIGERDTEPFPSASTIKTVVMAEAFRQAEEGTIKFSDKIKLWEKKRRHASMWSYYLDEGISVDVDGLIQLMMNVSDNTATVVLAEKLGAERIEKTLLSWGYKTTAWTSYPPAGNQRLVRLRQTYANMGVTTPAEMADLLGRIGRRELISRAASEKMIRIMSHQYWDDFISWMIPPDVVVASKVGALNRSRSDTAIVYGPTPYVLTIYTDNQKDQKWDSTNEGDEVIRKMSGIVWHHLNPGKPYQPAPDAKKWAPTGGGVE